MKLFRYLNTFIFLISIIILFVGCGGSSSKEFIPDVGYKYVISNWQDYKGKINLYNVWVQPGNTDVLTPDEVHEINQYIIDFLITAKFNTLADYDSVNNVTYIYWDIRDAEHRGVPLCLDSEPSSYVEFHAKMIFDKEKVKIVGIYNSGIRVS